MRSYEELRLTPVFISNEAGRRLATAFFVTMPVEVPEWGRTYAHAYLVTAKHCVIDGATRTPRERLRIEFPWMGEQGLAVQPIEVDWKYLSPEDLPADEWCLDLAIGMLTESAFTGHRIGDSTVGILSSDLVAGPLNAMLGRETVTAGLFSSAHGDAGSIEPVLRFGRVSSLPRTKVEAGMGRAEAVLVEGHAAAGMSGAPVFVHDGGSSWQLLGLHSGHFTVHSPVRTNAVVTASPDDGLSVESHVGMAIVTPAWRIRAMLDSRGLRRHRQRVEAEIRDFPWRFRDRRHRKIRGIVFAAAKYESMSEHPEASRGSHEYLIHAPAGDPYCTYGNELEWNTHGAERLGPVESLASAVSTVWPAIDWSEESPSRVTGRISIDGQDGEVTLYVDPQRFVRAIYLSDFLTGIGWERLQEVCTALERELARRLWLADITFGSYVVD